MGQQIIGQNGTPVLSKQEQFQHVVSTAITASLGLLAPGYKAVFFFLRDDHQHEIVLGNGTLRDVLNSIKEKVPAEELATIADTSGLVAKMNGMIDEAQAQRNAMRRALPFIDNKGGGATAKDILKRSLKDQMDMEAPVALRASAQESETRDKIIECLCNILAVHTNDIELLHFIAGHNEYLTDNELLTALEEWQERTPTEMGVVLDYHCPVCKSLMQVRAADVEMMEPDTALKCSECGVPLRPGACETPFLRG